MDSNKYEFFYVPVKELIINAQHFQQDTCCSGSVLITYLNIVAIRTYVGKLKSANRHTYEHGFSHGDLVISTSWHAG